MKKAFFVIILLATILITFIIFKNSSNFHEQKKSIANEIINTTDKISNLSDEDFKIEGVLIFDTTYEKLIKIMGKPVSINKIEDKNIATDFGYFSVISYEGVEFTINSNNSYDLANGNVAEIDIVSPKVSTSRGITINDTLDKIKHKYPIKYIYSFKTNSEAPLHTNVIKVFKRGEKELHLKDYDKYCFIQSNNKPIALIFLLKNNIVKRIVVRHLTAG